MSPDSPVELLRLGIVEGFVEHRHRTSFRFALFSAAVIASSSNFATDSDRV